MVKQAELVKLAKELCQLVERPVTNKVELAAWEDDSWNLQDRIRKDAELADVVPHAVWHYLADADIRLKDPRYREMQDKEIKEIIALLSKGQLPF